MPDTFIFDIDEPWGGSLARLKTYLEAQDSACAELLFQHLEILISNEEKNGRRDFNQLVLAALDALAEAEISRAVS
ncbi:MAG: hypothetical protein ABL863_04545 [Nitrosomonas sp.]